jgi:ABC-type molybdate transport system ATPase subunit
MYRKIINMDELKGLEEQLSDDRKLWVLDLVFDSSDMRRSNDFFAGIARLNKSLKVPFIFISSKTDYYRKATALLDGVLEGFPRVAGDIEEGVKFYLEREDRNG